MLRTMLCAVVALTLCVNVALAKPKKPRPVTGTISKIDKDASKLTVTVTNKKQGTTEDKVFAVADSTSFAIAQDDGTTTTVTGKDGLKDAKVVEGAKVKVTTADDGSVTTVEVVAKHKHKKSGQ